MSKIDAIKARYNFQDIAYSIVDDVTGGRGRGYTQHACIYCGSSDAFTVYEENFYCYSCDKHGDVIDLLAWKNNQTSSDFLRGNNESISPQQIEIYRAENAERKRIAKERADREYKQALDRLHEVKAWIRYNQNLFESEYAQMEWKKRGIDLEWQAYFELGYNPKFKYASSIGKTWSPTLAIPYRQTDGSVALVQHRLLNPLDSKKYLPDVYGLKNVPFICNPDMKQGRNLVVAEGAIKSAVTFITVNSKEYQVMGAMNKGEMKKVINKYRSVKNMIVIPDPDATEEIRPVCQQAGARMLFLPEKVDDYILDNKITTAEFRRIMSQARRI